MPYFSFSTQCDDPKAQGQTTQIQGAVPEALQQAKRKYQDLLEAYTAKGSVIHGSSTLDESYYHFSSDHGSTQDQKHRNKSQVVTKHLREGRRIDDLSHWPLLRVNRANRSLTQQLR